MSPNSRFAIIRIADLGSRGRDMKDLEGKVAVVTGAASGIGLGMATRFAEAGLKVVMADIERPVLEKAVATLKDREHDVCGVVVDVSHAGSVEELARETLRQYGAVHVLCNNAGVSARRGAIWELPQSEWDWVYGVNFWGVLHGIRVFVPLMLEQGDECHIVNTASIAGLMPWGGSIYGATKTGVVDISETLAEQLNAAESKIGVSVLCPGFVNTEILSSSRNRPGALQDEPFSDVVRDSVITRYVQAGKDPLDVGIIVLQAIEQNRFYVLTDDVWNDAIEMRPSSPSEDYLTVLAGQRQWIATTNFAGCPGRPPDSLRIAPCSLPRQKFLMRWAGPSTRAFLCRLTPKRNSLSRLWPVQISDHSPFTFSSPRSRNCRNPRPCLIWPNTGSTVCIRKA